MDHCYPKSVVVLDQHSEQPAYTCMWAGGILCARKPCLDSCLACTCLRLLLRPTLKLCTPTPATPAPALPCARQVEHLFLLLIWLVCM